MHIDEACLSASLQRLSPIERPAWLAEARRLLKIVEAYNSIRRKRRLNPSTGKFEFVEDVLELCEQARCSDPIILRREPHRARQLSPFTLDRWARSFRCKGVSSFFRANAAIQPDQTDHRCASISVAAIDWVNARWRRFDSPRHLYKALTEQALKHQWVIPGESWFYRRWEAAPQIIKTFYGEGGGAYESKYAPYAPHDFTDLAALQVLCGDHSERDVTVALSNGSLARPWLSLWYDLRTGLIWGWHLDVTPSSQTVGYAYADGVLNFGAQPVARPANDFYSYVFTDQGRDYRSHHWDGQTIAVHKCAMKIEGGLELLRVERRVGILEDLMIRHLVARGRNPKEKPVERVFRDISDWEQNTFQEFCGREPKERPDVWHRLYAQHQRGRAKAAQNSPFMSFETYRRALSEFISGYNSTAHERTNLGGQRVVPLAEYRRLYTTRYEIAPETLTLLLMKTQQRVVRKNGVQCFQRHWFFWHDRLSFYKGRSVEVRYADNDYSRVWVVLPEGHLCEARLITPTPLLHPNQQTLKTVAVARAAERRLIRDFHLITQSELRGETTEARVAKAIETEEVEIENWRVVSASQRQGRVSLMTRMDRRRLRAVPAQHEVTAEDVACATVNPTIFTPVSRRAKITEFDGDD
jgi:hypothetical protein